MPIAREAQRLTIASRRAARRALSCATRLGVDFGAEDALQRDAMVTDPVSKTASVEQLREILAGHESFAQLSEATLAALAGAAEREFVPAGRRLLTSGIAPSSAFLVEHGRLRGVDTRASERAGREVSLEFGRGDVCGLGLLVAQLPAAGGVIALRDSTVLRLGRDALLRCMAAHPELVTAQARHFYQTALRAHLNVSSRPRIFTLLPVGGDLDVASVARSFLRALFDTVGRGSAVDSARAVEILGAALGDGGGERLRGRLSEWCSREAEQGRLLLLVCDREDTPWTRWCLEQTDRTVVATSATESGALDAVRVLLASRPASAAAPIAIDLLLVHAPDVDVPRGTGPWLELDALRRHHHVRLGHGVDFERAVRRIAGRAVSLVLGGGGARALAHIGVLQALEDAGVPVDAVGGTSMGSVVAAAYARGWSPAQMLALFAERVPDGRALRDLDFPRVSLLAGRKLDAVLRFAFEDLDVADLWLPCFCVSADLADARMVVHDRGLLWQTVRASCSLPGIFPPVKSDGRLLVDGGVVNNVPIDVMEREHAGSVIIAVDVGAAGIGATDSALNILHVLTSSTTLGSKDQLKHLVADGHADLFLAPPVKHIKLLGFDARDALFEIGYAHAREQLAAWGGLARVVGGAAGARRAGAPDEERRSPHRGVPIAQETERR